MLTITAKKSQMEIVGLVIIVILISIAMLFFLQFSLKRTAAEKRTYTSAQLTSNMINTLSKTSTNCSGLIISDLYKFCADTEPVACDPDRIKDDDPCLVANTTVSLLLQNTLEQWEKDFRFQVFLPDTNKTVYYYEHNYPCAGNIETETYYIPTEFSGLLYMRLNICED